MLFNLGYLGRLFRKGGEKVGEVVLGGSYIRKQELARQIAKAFEQKGHEVFEAGVSFAIGDDYTPPLKWEDFYDTGFDSPGKEEAYDKWLNRFPSMSTPLFTLEAINYFGQARKYKQLADSPQLHKIRESGLERVLRELPESYQDKVVPASK